MIKPFKLVLFVVVLASVLLLALPPSAMATTYNTITIDGVNDFDPDEVFPGTSGSTWYFTWDATHFYFGITANDVDDNSATKFVVLYVDTDPTGTNGSSTGVNYNTQQPGLGFNADYHFRWRTDNTYVNMLDYNNTTFSWTDDNTSAGNFGIAAFQSGTYVEFSIPRASLGNPTSIKVAGSMLNEQAFNEWTYFLIPSNTSTAGDGYDANLGTSYLFTLNSGISPNTNGPTALTLTSLTAKQATLMPWVAVSGVLLLGGVWIFLRRKK